MSSIWSRIRDGLADLGWSGLFGLPGPAEASEPAPRTVATKQIGFTIAAIALGAKMSAADGSVSDSERRAFHEVFPTSPEQRPNVDYFFDLARRSQTGAELYARQAARLLERQKPILEDLLGALFHIARADGVFKPSEDDYLRRIAIVFGFDEAEYRRIRAYHIGSTEPGGGREIIEDPWLILGLPAGSSTEAARARWRQLVREHHPDLVMAQGLPAEFIAIANAKLARINAAYRAITAPSGLAAS